MHIRAVVQLTLVLGVLLLGIADAHPPASSLLTPSAAFQLEELLRGEVCLPPGRAAGHGPAGYLGESTLPPAPEDPTKQWMLKPLPD